VVKSGEGGGRGRARHKGKKRNSGEKPVGWRRKRLGSRDRDME